MRSNLILMVISAASLAFACPTRRPSKSTTTTNVPTASTVSAAPQVTQTTPAVVTDAAPTTTLATSVASVATSASVPSNSVTPIGNTGAVSGKSTFYGGNIAGGTCSFTTYSLPAGMFGTAFSGSAWNNAANCGACVRVTGPNGNSITAMIVDQCPECEEGHLDLFQDAFEQLGDLSAGIIETSYTFVDCGITSPITLHNKDGTSQYWFAMQVVNANEPVASLEVSTDGGNTWQQTTRASYNFFENQSGFGTDTVDVRVTSSSGKTIIVNDVSVASGSQATCGSNF